MKVQPKAHQSSQSEQPTPQWMLDDPELAEIFKDSRELTPEEEKREQEAEDLLGSIGLPCLDEF